MYVCMYVFDLRRKLLNCMTASRLTQANFFPAASPFDTIDIYYNSKANCLGAEHPTTAPSTTSASTTAVLTTSAPPPSTSASTAAVLTTQLPVWSTARLSVARWNVVATSVGNVALFAGGEGMQ